METGPGGTQKPRTSDEARKVLDEIYTQAGQTFKEAKRQADISRDEARKLAADKESRREADEAHKKAVEEAKKVCEDTTNAALADFSGFWKQQSQDIEDAAARDKERVSLAEKTYKDAKKQADADRKVAREKAVDSSGRDEADAAHKASSQKAKKDYDDSMKK